MDKWQTSLRFNLLNEDEKQAYDILQNVPKNHRNRYIINAILNSSEQITLQEINSGIIQILAQLNKSDTANEMKVGYDLEI